ncbi:sodium-dependent transporter [Thermococcus sp. AM4]|uniref:sodium-dependent transporter n=1 Tax=Thermococcus sp. (strain AM4) TaxID=246969 RepID=UPI0001871015|nr:sodium-dependent transporter [Thermococcus sp. AM4]EEB74304.1 conserved hypothetical protein [Thermococcus sp. AM4]
MDQIKKWTLYLMVLVAGFATGIGTIGLFPQMWLKYGLTGLILHVIFLAILTYLAILEAERVMKSGYYFTELYTKVSRKPGMILAIFAVGVMFLSYYTANTGLVLLSPVLGTGAVGRLVAKLIMIALILVVITRAKEKTFTIMAIGAFILVILVPVLVILFKTQVPKNAMYLSIAKNMLTARNPISLEMVRAAAERAIYGVGLGFGFYLMLGSFINERFNPKLIIGTGVFIQFIIGLLSTFAVIYAVTPYRPEEFLIYANGGEEQAITLMGDLPKILSNHPMLLAFLGLTIFMAGLTSLLPAAEIGVQITESLMKFGRSKAALYFMGIVTVIGIFDSPPNIADMFLKAVTTSLLLTSIFEAYPIMIGKEKPSTINVAVVLISLILFIAGFIAQVYYDIKLGGIYYASVVLALFIGLLGIMGEKIVPQGPE